VGLPTRVGSPDRSSGHRRHWKEPAPHDAHRRRQCTAEPRGSRQVRNGLEGAEVVLGDSMAGTRMDRRVVYVESVDEGVGCPADRCDRGGSRRSLRSSIGGAGEDVWAFSPGVVVQCESRHGNQHDQPLEGVGLRCSDAGNSEATSSVTQMEHNVAQKIQFLLMDDLHGGDAEDTPRASLHFADVALTRLGYLAHGSRPW
jgi:hypothetical protein